MYIGSDMDNILIVGPWDDSWTSKQIVRNLFEVTDLGMCSNLLENKMEGLKDGLF